ncbi:ribbon-helix-helix protein, CopG family [Sediminibacterium sp.]
MHRLQTNLDSQSFRNLERLAKSTGMNKREIIEKAINELAERLDCNHDKD